VRRTAARAQVCPTQPLDGTYTLQLMRTGAVGAPPSLNYVQLQRAGAAGAAGAAGDWVSTEVPDAEVSSAHGGVRRVRVRTPGGAGKGGVTFALQELEERAAGLGHAVWPASVAGAAWLARVAAPLSGESAPLLALRGDGLELGSGVGLFGLAAGTAAAALWRAESAAAVAAKQQPPPRPSLTLSDLSLTLQKNLEKNIAANGSALQLQGAMLEARAVRLNWDAALRATYVPERRYDWMVAADVVYNPGNAQTLVACAAAHLKEGGRLLLICQSNRRGFPQALEALRAHGTVVQVHAALTHRPELLDVASATSSSTSDALPHRSTVYGIELVVFTKHKRALTPP